MDAVACPWFGPSPRQELRFRSLFQAGRSYAFPCDPQGRILLETLSPRQRASLASVWLRVGHELAPPEVVHLAHQAPPA